MAQTPFSTTSPTYYGQATARVIDPSTSFRHFWLGLPGNMIQLNSPFAGYTVDSDGGEVAHKLLSNGNVVTRIGSTKRTYTMNWGRAAGRDMQIVRGFHSRAFGNGPWCLVTPEDTNRLTGNAALCGAVNGDISAWAVTASTGSLSVLAGATPGIYPSAVMQWAGAGSASQIALVCDIATATTPGTAIPVLLAESTTFSVYLATASGTASVSLYLQTRSAANATVGSYGSGTFTVTTTPTRFSWTVAPGTMSGAPYVVPLLSCGTASAPNILISAPQVEYETSATPWQLGRSVPRVIMPSSPSRTVDPRLFNDTSLVLAEV